MCIVGFLREEKKFPNEGEWHYCMPSWQVISLPQPSFKCIRLKHSFIIFMHECSIWYSVLLSSVVECPCQALSLCLSGLVTVLVKPCHCACQALSLCLSGLVTVLVKPCHCACQALSLCLSGLVTVLVKPCRCACQALSLCTLFTNQNLFGQGTWIFSSSVCRRTCSCHSRRH